MLQACLNGSRSHDEHPRVPVTVEEIAGAARDAVAAGADSLHVHARDVSGRESLDADDCADVMRAVRRACPRIPGRLSTGLWISDGDRGARAAAVGSWSELPDFLRVLVEVDGDDRESLALAAAIEEIVAPAASSLLEHGYGRAT